jgi:hypothetical protein
MILTYIMKRKTQTILKDVVKKNKRSFNSNPIKSKNNDKWDKFNKYNEKEGIPKFVDTNIYDYSTMISATQIKNGLLDDKIADALKFRNGIPKIKYHNTNNKRENILFDKGNRFEDTIVKKLKEKYGNNVKQVINDLSEFDINKMDLTKQYMMEGVPIILQAVLYNEKNLTFGVSDILIRSDWLPKVYNISPITEEDIKIKAPNLNGNYHYRVIDIKWSNIKISTDGFSVLNQDRLPSYKGQLAIYNAIVGQIQGYTPDITYLMGKTLTTIYTKNKKDICERDTNCFNKLGQINYEFKDNKYIDMTIDAIDWTREARFLSHTWCFNPPSRKELYPNMCKNFDLDSYNEKLKLAKDIGEMTLLWNVNKKHRETAHDNGVYSIHDPDCTSEIMGINKGKRSDTINKILEINRNDKLLIPNIINNNMGNWKNKYDYEFYLDFETVQMSLLEDNMNIYDSSENNGEIVCMIGVGYTNSVGEWEYTNFNIKNCTREEEEEMFYDFFIYLNSFTNGLRKIKLFHWNHTEKTIINNFNKRTFNLYDNYINTFQFVDMYKIFVDEPIVVSGSYDFTLKNIGKAMYKNNMIKSCWDTNIKSGYDALFEAINIYKKKKITDDNLQNIITYNEYDCKILNNIVSYLRKNHVK